MPLTAVPHPRRCFALLLLILPGLIPPGLILPGGVPRPAAAAPDPAPPPAAAPATAEAPGPGVPIRFHLREPGFVTLVIDDARGQRVRNLVSETPFPAGDNVAWWDGLDDTARDTDAAAHAVYHVPGRLVAPARYRVRGLVRPKIDLRYELTPYNEGNPPWHTASADSEWLANHTAPGAVLFLPEGAAPVREAGPAPGAPGGQILVGSMVSEGGSGVAWLDLTGRKLHGQLWIGGVWTGATHFARDAGDRPVPGVYAYTASAWPGDKYNGGRAELRLFALLDAASRGAAPGDKRMGTGEDRPVLRPDFHFEGDLGDFEKHGGYPLGGLAARNGIVVAGLKASGQLLFVDAAAGEVLGTTPLPDPRGLAFDAQGRLLALSGTSLLRLSLPATADELAARLTPGPLVRLDRKGWQASAGANSSRLAAALDRDPATRWDTAAAQAPGQWFTLDLGSPRPVCALALDAGTGDDYPRGYELYRSDDGQNWGKPVAFGEGAKGRMVISFPRTTTRYLRVVQTRQAGNFWSIYEVDAYDARPPAAGDDASKLPAPAVLVDKGFQDPQGLTLDARGNAYVSDWGDSHQVSVFDPEGRPLRSVGKPGRPTVGPYDPGHMNHPNGLTIDGEGRLWVAETDKSPKRLSVWSPRGELLKALYGPPQYGGGGWLDPLDKSRFFYADEGGMELKLDWETGRSWPVAVYYRRELDPLRDGAPGDFNAGHAPETPIHLNGRDYLTDCYSTSPTNGSQSAAVWLLEGGIARRGAVMGQAKEWPALKGLLPPGEGASRDPLLFVWTDANGDGRMQADELQFLKGETGGITVMPDLSFVAAWVGDRAMRFAPARFTPQGLPVYDLEKGQVLVEHAQRPTSSGGGQALVDAEGRTVLTVAPGPFAPQSVGGASGSSGGRGTWSYPSLWPGLHASHNAPMPQFPGELIGTTRLLGGTVKPAGSDAGELWADNGNKGNVYLFTTDGLFVATLFRDSRTASWSMPRAERDMPVDEASLGEENFWPSITQTVDGRIYLTAANSAIVRVEGLEKIRRLPDAEVEVTAGQLAAARAAAARSELDRREREGKHAPAKLKVAILPAPPAVDGVLDDWAGADWAVIDERTDQVGDWGHRKAQTAAALAVSGDSLYAAFRTNDPHLLTNAGGPLPALFKTGGALDLMIGSGAGADPARTAPVAGDERLLVTRVKGRTTAALYRAIVPGAGGEPVPFTSPLRTVRFDRVDDVSDQVRLACGPDGACELSVPLSVLGLRPEPGRTIRADLGLLRGDGAATLQRVYWANKAAGLMSDVPGEAELLPRLWGDVTFERGR